MVKCLTYIICSLLSNYLTNNPIIWNVKRWFSIFVTHPEKWIQFDIKCFVKMYNLAAVSIPHQPIRYIFKISTCYVTTHCELPGALYVTMQHWRFRRRSIFWLLSLFNFYQYCHCHCALSGNTSLSSLTSSTRFTGFARTSIYQFWTGYLIQ